MSRLDVPTPEFEESSQNEGEGNAVEENIAPNQKMN
jgi:hypothetical protein